ncbi:MAG: succinate dehydrogenase cytochrome b subunit [Bacteroidales bacterium]|nr:succinate dehydrogenase cytochrome b subunit [Bacteroidales bacterium]
MSTAAIKPKGARVVPPDAGPETWACHYLSSTVGSKVLVAVTGLLLVGFVVFHMIGNLKLLFGRDDVNAYAHFLKHGLGPLLWIARGGLLAVFVVHLALAFRLQLRASAARPIGYVYQRSAQATPQSRTMLMTGIVVGLFVLFHLAHFTFGWVHSADIGGGRQSDYLHLLDEQGRHDVYSMVVAGFRTPWLSILYIVAQLVLFCHLSHGIQSTIQSLGLKASRFAPVWSGLGYATAATILIGNVAIVLAVWIGLVPPVFPMVK